MKIFDTAAKWWTDKLRKKNFSVSKENFFRFQDELKRELELFSKIGNKITPSVKSTKGNTTMLKHLADKYGLNTKGIEIYRMFINLSREQIIVESAGLYYYTVAVIS